MRDRAVEGNAVDPEVLEVCRAWVGGSDEDEGASPFVFEERSDAVTPHVRCDGGGISAEAVVEGRGVASARVADVPSLAIEDEEPARLVDSVANGRQRVPAGGPVGLEEGEVGLKGGGHGSR